MARYDKMGALIIVFATTVLITEAVHVSIGNMLDSTMSVHCMKGGQDKAVRAPVRAVQPMKEIVVDLNSEYHGPYVCSFEAAGKRTTTVDLTRSRCNCNSYNGCAWVAWKDGFTCNHEFMCGWA